MRQHHADQRQQHMDLALSDDVIHEELGRRGSTRPDTRLITISPKPSASSPRRGRISRQISGRALNTSVFFSGFFPGRLGHKALDSSTARPILSYVPILPLSPSPKIASGAGISASLSFMYSMFKDRFIVVALLLLLLRP